MTDSPFVQDPANPTDAELAAAIDRGLADGSLTDAADWMRANADAAPETSTPLGKPGKAIVTDTIVPSDTHAYKIRGRWYWVTEIESTMSSGSQFVITVPVAKDPRYAQIGLGKMRYVQTGNESFMVRAQTPPRWAWVSRKLRCATVGCKRTPAETITYDWRNDRHFATERVCTPCADSYSRRPVITHLTRTPIEGCCQECRS